MNSIAVHEQISELTQDRCAPDFSRLSCEDLAIYAQQGDRCAFLELVDRNYKRCFRLACSIMRNQDDAEDQVQNAFARALEHLGQFRYRAKFSSWLCRIVINQCRMRFRETQRTRSVGTAEDCYRQGSVQSRDAAPNPEQTLLERDLWDAVEMEIQLLPTVYRKALVLRYVDDLSLQDMADRLGVTVPTVKSRLFRGQIELRRRMLTHLRSGTGRRPMLKA